MANDPDKLWSEAEDRAVETFYPRHGSDWIGWYEVLPERGKRAIVMRARRLGAEPPPRRRAAPDTRKADPVPMRSEPREYEERVVALMDSGMTPTEIDRKMHWRAGTAIQVILERWGKASEQEE